jgi:hypothetical protein
MDAKTRYPRRLKLQAAMTRVWQVLLLNEVDGIEADRRTALMAAGLGRMLLSFCQQAGLTPAEAVPVKPDATRFVKILTDRRRATKARTLRKRRSRSG